MYQENVVTTVFFTSGEIQDRISHIQTIFHVTVNFILNSFFQCETYMNIFGCEWLVYTFIEQEL